MTDIKTQQSTVAFNPFSPDFVRNPYPDFHRLRDSDPIHMSMIGAWVVSRYDDVDTILRDRRFGKDNDHRMKLRYGDDVFDNPVFEAMRHWMLLQDPPDHTRLRGLVAKAFTARQIETWRASIERLVDELIDRVEAKGEMEFISEFARPLPLNVICAILGINSEYRDRFDEISGLSGRVIDPTPLSDEELKTANEGYLKIDAFFRDLIAKRRNDLGDDLISVLIDAEEEGERLTEKELITNVFLLFAAGHETTVNLLGNGMLALLQRPDQWEMLKDKPDLVKQGVEEMLRFDSSVQMTSRVVMEDVEVGGVEMSKGQVVICLLGAGNRDPEEFANPDEFDITRENVRPQSFGGGIHHCLGAMLARVEAEIAIKRLMTRLPNLRLAHPDEQRWRPTFTLRGLSELPMKWS
jgi:cytochrome P450